MPFSKFNTSLKGDILIFVLPILGLMQIELIGELFLHEIILILLFPILWLKRGRLLNQTIVKIILLFGFLWLISQIITDIYRETPQEDFLRGWAKIIFFLIAFSSLVMLLTTPHRCFLWISASTIPMFLRPFELFAQDLDPYILWKFGVGPAVLLLTCLPSLWRLLNNSVNVAPVRRIALLYIAFGVGSFFVNARSFAGISIATGVLLLVYSRKYGIKLRIQSLAVGLIFSVLGAVVLINIYAFGASSGFFGNEAQVKYEIQTAHGGGTIAILLGGRSEGLISSEAIADSPFIGHGSWAKDYKYLIDYIGMRRTFSEDEGNPLDPDVNDGLIPSHSYLLGAWVESGMVGGVFWISIVFISLFIIVPSAFEIMNMLGVYCLMTLPMFFWNILFSPFGANVRVEVAGTLAIFIMLLKLNKMVLKE
jgi:hypothetical protein